MLEQLRDYTIDETAIANAVREANGGRDDVVKNIDAEVERRKSALATAKSAVDRLLAMIEEGEGSGTRSRGRSFDRSTAPPRADLTALWTTSTTSS